MNRVIKTGLTITFALGAAWVVCGQGYDETPLPPPAPAPPGSMPRAMRVPRPAIAPRTPRMPQPPAIPDSWPDESSFPVIAPMPPEPPDVPEPSEWLDMPAAPLPPVASLEAFAYRAAAFAERAAAMAPRIAGLAPDDWATGREHRGAAGRKSLCHGEANPASASNRQNPV